MKKVKIGKVNRVYTAISSPSQCLLEREGPKTVQGSYEEYYTLLLGIYPESLNSIRSVV